MEKKQGWGGLDPAATREFKRKNDEKKDN